MAKSVTFKITGMVVDAYSGKGNRGEFHTVTINIGREVKLFSEVSLEAFKDKEANLICTIVPNYDGSAKVQVLSVA